jgi:hypothetical protein
MAKDAVLREAPRESPPRAAMIRLAPYGEEEFLIGIPGSNGEGVLWLRSKRLRARPSESSSFDSGNRSLAARDFPRSQGLSEATLIAYPRCRSFPLRSLNEGPPPDGESTSSKRL